MNKIYKVKLKTTNVLKNTANRVGFYDDEELIKYLELMNDEIDFKKMGFVYANEALRRAIFKIKEGVLSERN